MGYTVANLSRVLDRPPPPPAPINQGHTMGYQPRRSYPPPPMVVWQTPGAMLRTAILYGSAGVLALAWTLALFG